MLLLSAFFVIWQTERTFAIIWSEIDNEWSYILHLTNVQCLSIFNHTKQTLKMTIDKILDQIYEMPESSKETLKQNITEISLPKGHILLKAQQVEKSIYFIKKGIVRAFAPLEEQDITFWFGEEGETILSMKSYVENKKGYENIELLENCELYELNTRILNELYYHDIHITNWGRRLAEKELLKIESRMISVEFKSAKERYDELITNFPSLLQRVPLKYIASYLGITQVSLSRIRKEK